METETTNKDVTLEDLEDSAKQADEQLGLMEWKLESVQKEIAVPTDSQEACVLKLLQSVTEVRQDYQQLRQELETVQALQRELSGRLRAQLSLVHGKFARLRERLAHLEN